MKTITEYAKMCKYLVEVYSSMTASAVGVHTRTRETRL